MKRRLFFWIEKLKISRNERYAVISLMVILTGLVFVNAAITPRPLDDDRYAALDKRFEARTMQMRQQQKQLIAKYHGKKLRMARIDTIPKDTARKKKTHTKTNTHAHELINVNTADEKTLQKLKGIGPAYAHRIAVYRQKNGSFTTKKELIKIKGIGKKRLAKIKPFIKLTVQK